MLGIEFYIAMEVEQSQIKPKLQFAKYTCHRLAWYKTGKTILNREILF